MHMYRKCDINIPRGSKVMNIGNRQMDGLTHIVIIVQTQGSCNYEQAHDVLVLIPNLVQIRKIFDCNIVFIFLLIR